MTMSWKRCAVALCCGTLSVPFAQAPASAQLHLAPAAIGSTTGMAAQRLQLGLARPPDAPARIILVGPGRGKPPPVTPRTGQVQPPNGGRPMSAGWTPSPNRPPPPPPTTATTGGGARPPARRPVPGPCPRHPTRSVPARVPLRRGPQVRRAAPMSLCPRPCCRYGLVAQADIERSLNRRRQPVPADDGAGGHQHRCCPPNASRPTLSSRPPTGVPGRGEVETPGRTPPPRRRPRPP